MFQKIRGAIDQTIAQEQARQKAAADRVASGSAATVRRTNSSASSLARRTKKAAAASSKDVKESEGATSDPAVFEAAFVLDDDDTDGPSRTGTPKPPLPEKDDAPTDSTDTKGKATAETSDGAKSAPAAESAASAGSAGEQSAPSSKPGSPAPGANQELPPNIKTKLRKLEKLEATYRGSQYVNNVMVYGDGTQPRAIAVIAPNEKPFHELADSLGVDHAQAPTDSKVKDAVFKDLIATGKKAGLTSLELVGGVVICAEEWTPTNVSCTVLLLLLLCLQQIHVYILLISRTRVSSPPLRR